MESGVGSRYRKYHSFRFAHFALGEQAQGRER